MKAASLRLTTGNNPVILLLEDVALRQQWPEKLLPSLGYHFLIADLGVGSHC